MQILSEQGVQLDRKDNYSNMADVLVDMECHELLFQILEKYEDDQGETYCLLNTFSTIACVDLSSLVLSSYLIIVNKINVILFAKLNVLLTFVIKTDFATINPRLHVSSIRSA